MSKCVRFAGKVAVITASSEGIGFGIALRLCQEGCCVVISSRKQDNVDKALQTLKKVCANANAVGIVCHIGESLQRKNLIRFATETFGKIDILVSNAAVNPQLGGILDVPERVIDKVIDVNIKSAIMLVREAVPYMSDTGANIVFISSVAGYDAFEHLGVYSVSKTALLGLTKTLAKELSSQGIRVNCVAPGTIPTKLSSKFQCSSTLQISKRNAYAQIMLDIIWSYGRQSCQVRLKIVIQSNIPNMSYLRPRNFRKSRT
eukprot:TRINITY_DN16479_c0_g1_i3.p1 TRINITY_DN16479_c0_g1~~TRINITY_DN16479_c0_g1_i3.p1  ORF type:complete len:260 (-),score=1.94 TRINITY_DN16479_c0_g1_i3:165-944(-)